MTCLLLVGAWITPLPAEDPFGPAIVIAEGPIAPAHVIAGDLDADGDADIVFATFHYPGIDNRVYWIENADGQGGMATPVLVGEPEPVEYINDIFVSDLDGDGLPDVLASVNGTTFLPALQWFENLGGASGFTSPTTLLFGASRGCQTADFDGDGDQDIHSWHGTPKQSLWIENDGTGNFGPEQQLSNKSTEEAVAADLDGDGDLDVCGSTCCSFFWTENDLNATGVFEPRETISDHGFGQSGFAVGDMDLDGDLDYLGSSSGDDELVWLPNTDGLGTLGLPILISSAADFPTDIGVRDIDGDGDPDVYAPSAHDSEVAWYPNDGSGSFPVQNVVDDTALWPDAMTSADFDGDGDADVATAATGDSEVAWYENLDGLGTFGGESVVSSSPYGAAEAFVVDVDGDGDPDAVTTHGSALAWYPNDGAGNFGSAELFGQNTGHTDHGDLDADGDVDFLTGSAYGVWALRNDGNGTFEQLVDVIPLLYPGGLKSVKVGDLTGDGAVEVVVVEADELSWFGNVDGLGSFGPGQLLTHGSDGLREAAVADVDSDGDLDLFLASLFSGGVTWFENLDGAGTFSAVQPVSPTGAEHVEIGDIDGDGDRDALVGNAGFVRWTENQDGAGTFGAGSLVVSAPGTEISDTLLEDVDGDGDLDLVLTRSDGGGFTDGSVHWVENLGAGSFGSLQLIDSVAQPRAVGSGDLDDDGDVDLLIPSDSESRLQWYPGLACDAVSAAIVREGSPPNPVAFLPVAGVPAIGTTWEIAVDHTTFLPAAVVDFIIATSAPVNIPLGPEGTLLCAPLAPFIIELNFTPGSPFVFPIAPDCSMVGATVCLQGGSIDSGGGFLLANALDVTVGSF